MNLLDLPNEIIEHIVNFYPDIRFKIKRVCKYLNTLFVGSSNHREYNYLRSFFYVKEGKRKMYRNFISPELFYKISDVFDLDIKKGEIAGITYDPDARYRDGFLEQNGKYIRDDISFPDQIYNIDAFSSEMIRKIPSRPAVPLNRKFTYVVTINGIKIRELDDVWKIFNVKSAYIVFRRPRDTIYKFIDRLFYRHPHKISDITFDGEFIHFADVKGNIYEIEDTGSMFPKLRFVDSLNI